MARLALLAVALVAVTFLPQIDGQYTSDFNRYFRTRPEQNGRGSTTTDRGRGETGRTGETWDWEWDQTAEREAEGEMGGTREGGMREGGMREGGMREGGMRETGESSTGTTTSRTAVDRLTTLVEELQVRLFMNDMRDSSRMYQDTCPKMMEMLERGFMRNWLLSYMQRTRGAETERPREEYGAEREREGEWSSGYSRLLRRRDPVRDTGRDAGRDTGRDAPRNGAGPEENNPMWQGLMASCYVYQDLVHGNAPRLESSSPSMWGRSAAAAQQ